MTANIGWGPFSQSKHAAYMRFVQDKELTVSINYWSGIAVTSNIKVDGSGLDGLSDYGKDVYQKNFTNFGLMCGDNTVTSFKAGAKMMLGLVPEFRSPKDKKIYVDYVKKNNVTFPDIHNTTMEFNKTVSELGIDGTFQIVAY